MTDRVWSEPARRAGDWLRDHQRAIRRLQWGVVATYLLLILVPVFLPLPGRAAHLWNNVTVFAQFVFWGIWWPFVLLSMIVVGRSWCGFFCPEGTLTEFASRHGRGRGVPRWVTWGGWPFVAFALTTIYGQMVSVYQYPRPVLLILGGSTVGAMVIGWLYGRNKRVWCRYLCPVNGVFALLAKLAPVHFRVDRDAWSASAKPLGGRRRVNCAPLVPIKTMEGAGACHMCGKCSGFREAVQLAPRSPNAEIVGLSPERIDPWETVLILFGLMGVAVGAFHWVSSPWFIATKQAIAVRLIEAGQLWPLEWSLPWWILTNYPEQNDVLTVLDGAILLGYIVGTAVVMGIALSMMLAVATRAAGPWSWPRFHHLAQALIPLAGCGVFLGLSSLTVTILRADGIRLHWVNDARAAFLAGAAAWSLVLAWRIAGRYAHGIRRILSVAAVASAVALGVASWVVLFWVW
ncbi:MAG: 4Fe-4S binding protein [Gemmatimonas sp.]